MCVKPFKDYNGDGEGDVGAVNGRNSNGTAIGGQQPDEVWTGTSYFIAAMMYHWGKQTNDTQLTATGIENRLWSLLSNLDK